MVLKVLGDWDFTPEFMGNKDMVFTMHPLSGNEELQAGYGDKRDPGKHLDLMITEIQNPIELEFEDGKKRKMTPADIANISALKHLYIEVLVEYGQKTSIDEEASKN